MYFFAFLIDINIYQNFSEILSFQHKMKLFAMFAMKTQ